MKLTKSQLKQLIKEEIEQILNEGWDRSCFYAFDDVKDEYYDKGGNRYGWHGKIHSTKMNEAAIMANEKKIRQWC